MLTSFAAGDLAKGIIEFVVTGSDSPEEILRRLDSYDIEWYVTEQGDLMIRYWQVGAEDFVPTELAGRIREAQIVPHEADALEWFSAHLRELEATYAGQWIAVVDDQVIASASDLSHLLEQVHRAGVHDPLITEIPSSPVVWTTAYAG